MKIKVLVFACISLVFILCTMLALSGNFPSSNYGSVGNPTAKEILKGNPDADILKLDGLIYYNVSDAEWFNEEVYKKGEKIGKVQKKTTNTWWYLNLYSSKLPKGTAVFASNGTDYNKGDAPTFVLVEFRNELLVYHAAREG
ncbi:hypothetical protein HNQ94_000075 [Salirhabdus euzebyi]|uniref:Uncharacterized protein n=1 Tax=Salirhabdus euzebyi TaxID=394506 RepID=A0A841PVA7_9BACI|nr:hypothetical protein [Salirhabdus euzebyi]MBB6451654.1 hypothetical protein [Salirhabdus euzebyi]